MDGIKNHAGWQLLNRKARYRFEKLAEGCFELGFDEPELIEIVNSRQLAVAVEWAMHAVSGHSSVVDELVILLVQRNAKRIIEKYGGEQ